MSFEVKKRYRLTWAEDTPCHGMEVTIKSMSVGTLFRLDEIVDAMRAAQDHETVKTLAHERAELIATHLIEWNLTDDGTSIETTAAGVLQLDTRLITEIHNQWIRANASVPDPLPNGSSSGEPFPEESIPMEPSLTSQPN